MRKNKTIIKSILVILLAISPLTPMLSIVHGENLAQQTFQGARPINELFPDENLANAVAGALGMADSSAAVTANDLEEVTNLEAYGRNIRDLTGMEYLSEIMFIQLSNNLISDLTPLEHLTNIMMLQLNVNHITDVSPLADKSIFLLQLNNNHISDLSPLDPTAEVVATEQTIALPETIVNKPTNFVLRNRQGYVPNHTINGGDDAGNYVGTQLTWLRPGEHRMTWHEENFSGAVTQTVILANRIMDYFPDNNLAQTIATVLNGNNDTSVLVSEEQLASITNLQVINSEVQNLEGMEFLTGLTTLEIVGTKVSDIHPIGGLINLISLDLRNNEIENINSLSNLTNLTTLLLDENKVGDISALSTLVDLTSLKLESNQITDVTPLQNLNNLHTLNLNSNQIMDISSLPQVASTTGFSALNQTVTLETGYLLVPQKINLLNQYGEYPTVTNEIGAGTFVDGLLTWTEAIPDGKNRLRWIGPVAFQGVLEQEVQHILTIYDLFEDDNLARAIALALNNNEANAVVAIDDLASIKTLNIAGRGISSLSGMQHLTGLEFLNASMNRISDLNHLNELTELQSLNLNFNNISDIKPLENMKKLTDLSLNQNALTDISILSNGFNINRFTAINQSVLLPEAPIGMPTPLTLLDSENQLPAITYLIGTGNYDSVSNTLTWSTVGDNYMLWASETNSVTNFSGTLHQRVNNTTIKALFPDENFAQIIATKLRKDSINAVVTFNELASIEDIAAINRQVRSIEGVQYLTNLKDLVVFNNQITNLTPLSNLINLRRLNIGFNEVTDISPLANLQNLETLDMDRNKISDISTAANLPSLMHLRFILNQVSDLRPLEHIIDGLSDFRATNQKIYLPTVVVGQATPITIRNHLGEVPTFTSITGHNWTYDHDKHELIWTTTGDNSFWFSGPISFSGEVEQKVVASSDEL